MIYLLDDEPEILTLLSDVAESSGLVAHTYTYGQDLLDEVAEFSVDAILMLDLQMPQMDGIEVMRRLVQAQMSPRLILMSGQDIGVLYSAEKLARAHGLEVIASLSKPISIKHFRQVLQEVAISPEVRVLGADHSGGHEIDEAELRHAIGDEQMVLHYQPQFDLASGALTSVEALVRWNHPELGLIFPDRFLPLAERTGAIGELTSWVIEEAVGQAQRWYQDGLPVTVSANISAFDITSLTLPEQLAELLTSTRLDPTRLVLELTESALMGELVTSLDILTRLRLKGIELSIDDFGTGYSSLSQLHRVPFTELKVDRSFIMAMSEDQEARAIVKTCIMLGHELNMKVVGEGVETQRHFDILRDLGCDRGQGYFLSRPAGAEQITKQLQESKDSGHSGW
ncbi:MAG: EAL domain-containing response regulator [Halieaceae bacterium]|jgi:EAL domain-containing protein (putative c-di-GMP-specific phosphodiesterase class I)/CheY-like chemotaxis protein|nr:EAL domain-containing response regulator [Halieaceae bacterium]